MVKLGNVGLVCTCPISPHQQLPSSLIQHRALNVLHTRRTFLPNCTTRSCILPHRLRPQSETQVLSIPTACTIRKRSVPTVLQTQSMQLLRMRNQGRKNPSPLTLSTLSGTSQQGMHLYSGQVKSSSSPREEICCFRWMFISIAESSLYQARARKAFFHRMTPATRSNEQHPDQEADIATCLQYAFAKRLAVLVGLAD